MPTPLTVLVADDDDSCRSTLQKVLVEEGYAVIAVADGASALELLAAAADGLRARPDAVILDVMMPGCSGLGVLSLMRRFSPRPPTFLMTAFDDPSVDVVARRLGSARVFHKPIEVDDVLAALKSATES